MVVLDHVTKKIIGRGYESGGLYLFDHQVPQAVVCLVVPSPFEVHCRLGHPSLFVLKKLYPEFRRLVHHEFQQLLLEVCQASMKSLEHFLRLCFISCRFCCQSISCRVFGLKVCVVLYF
uniref:GAG-pre-integrase domain-containing protein n=1 Tax=Cucumis melo TaxID=3656 RepID=A0A9I9CII3_CUCME